ncbi:MAG: hypothetical protein JO056_01760 [Alphaproteobacteria bacterium]|jgi:hypothetical protein|nr:hypothetical protein [Alphaproteobacteria bacterium]
MRRASLIVSGFLLAATGATAQPAANRASLQHVAAYDDLTCAARYTLAAFAIQDLDASASAYYVGRAQDAGKRYLALHPGESEQSYTARVTADARSLQSRLVNNGLTPEGLIAEIKSCDEAADTRNVT